eukprot:315333-Hanusia_phi.AAC.4
MRLRRKERKKRWKTGKWGNERKRRKEEEGGGGGRRREIRRGGKGKEEEGELKGGGEEEKEEGETNLREPEQVHLLPRYLELLPCVSVEQDLVSVRVADKGQRLVEDVGLAPGVVIVSSFLEVDEEEEIVPHVVVLLDVILEARPGLARLVEQDPVEAANETLSCDLFIERLLSLAQLRKGVDDDAEDDIHQDGGDDDVEQEGVEHAVDDQIAIRVRRVINGPRNLMKGFTQVTLAQSHIQHDQHALPDGRTSRSVVVGIQSPPPFDVRSLKPELLGEEEKADDSEDVVHDDEQDACLDERSSAVGDGLDHTPQDSAVVEDFEEMDEEEQKPSF